MRLSFRKKMDLGNRIFAAVDESIELHKKFEVLNREILSTQKELNESAKKLLKLHKELMDDAGVPDEVEAVDDGTLQVATIHGTYIVGSECPTHKRVHNLNGWYICVDGGFVNVNGWHPGKRR